MLLIDRIRSQANNPAAIATENDPEVSEYDGNGHVEGLGTITDLRDQYDLGPVDGSEGPDAIVIQDMRDDPNSELQPINEEEENLDDDDEGKQVVIDLRDDPNYDLGPEPSNEAIDTDTVPTDDDDDEDEEVDEKAELLSLTREELVIMANELGIEGAASLPNKDAIADAIIEESVG